MPATTPVNAAAASRSIAESKPDCHEITVVFRIPAVSAGAVSNARDAMGRTIKKNLCSFDGGGTMVSFSHAPIFDPGWRGPKG